MPFLHFDLKNQMCSFLEYQIQLQTSQLSYLTYDCTLLANNHSLNLQQQAGKSSGSIKQENDIKSVLITYSGHDHRNRKRHKP